MAIGETLLKITDYPFTYSIAFLLMRINEVDFFSIDATPYLLGAGFGATIMTIVDPFGRGLKTYIEIVTKTHLRRHGNSEIMFAGWDDIKSALHTAPIEAEKDRIVSIIYFLLIMLIFINFISDNEFYEREFNQVILLDSECDVSCSQDRVRAFMIVTSLIVAGVGGWKASQIIKKVKIEGVYLLSVNSPFVLESTKENLGNYIKLGDWETANTWKEKIETEFLEEEKLKKEREEKLRNHINIVFEKFQKHRRDCKSANLSAMMDGKAFNASSNYKDTEQILKEFEYYDSLMEHIYTTTDKTLFNLFKKLIELDREIQKKNKEWKKLRDEELEKILSGLEMTVQKKPEGGIEGPKDQYINLNMLKLDLERFMSFDLKELRPNKSKGNSSIRQVRFFENPENPPRDNVIAELLEEDAGRLKKGLEDLVAKLYAANEPTIKMIGESVSANNEFNKVLDEALIAHSLIGEPIKGSCTHCRNDRFYDGETILQHKREIEKFPEELKKENLKPKWSRP